MKNLCNIYRRSFTVAYTLIVMAGILFFAGSYLASCSKDDPVNPVNNHRPNGGNGDDDGNDNGNGNNGNGGNDGNGNENGGSTTGDDNADDNADDRTESELRIVGIWLRSDGLEKVNLGLDGSYVAYSCTQKESEWVEYAVGHYVYHDLANRLWIETFGEDNTDINVVYRTEFEGRDKLTLWTNDNHKRSFTRM